MSSLRPQNLLAAKPPPLKHHYSALQGTNRAQTQISADCRCRFLAFSWKTKHLGSADFRRKPQKTAGTRRKPQIGVCPFRFVPLSAAQSTHHQGFPGLHALLNYFGINFRFDYTYTYTFNCSWSSFQECNRKWFRGPISGVRKGNLCSPPCAWMCPLSGLHLHSGNYTCTLKLFSN